jgi:FMN reductase
MPKEVKDMRRIAVVSAGLSKPSSTRMLADRLAEATVSRLEEKGFDVTVDTFELRDTAQDVTNNMLTGFPSPALEEVIEKVTTADALIVVTPVFTTSYNGLFKSFFDVIDNQALVDMPVLIGATAGTPRHSLVLDYALRPLFTYLHAVVAPTGVFAASADWGDGGDKVKTLHYRVERAAGELAALAESSNRSSQLRDPFALDASFSPTGSYMID